MWEQCFTKVFSKVFLRFCQDRKAREIRMYVGAVEFVFKAKCRNNVMTRNRNQHPLLEKTFMEKIATLATTFGGKTIAAEKKENMTSVR